MISTNPLPITFYPTPITRDLLPITRLVILKGRPHKAYRWAHGKNLTNSAHVPADAEYTNHPIPSASGGGEHSAPPPGHVILEEKQYETY